MAIDFGALPPEINSARLYAGVGSTPLATAASAWNSLAAELNAAALGYENVVTQLAGEDWLGAILNKKFRLGIKNFDLVAAPRGGRWPAEGDIAITRPVVKCQPKTLSQAARLTRDLAAP